jgi:hypothetical protein
MSGHEKKILADREFARKLRVQTPGISLVSINREKRVRSHEDLNIAADQRR